MSERLIVGAVAYHPRSSRSGRASATTSPCGAPTDYVLFSNYERLVEALLAGRRRHRLEHEHRLRVGARQRAGGDAQVLACATSIADFRTVVVTRAARRSTRRPSSPASGSRSAAATPARRRSCRCTISARPGVELPAALTLVPVRHRSRQARRHRRLRAPGRPGGRRGRGRRRRDRRRQWAAMRSEGVARRRRARGRLAEPHVLPLQLHRAAVVRPRAAARWSEALLAMNYDDPSVRELHGPRGGEALAAGRQERLRRPDGGDAGAGVSVTAHRVDAGTLELGAGLETLVRAALQSVPPGGELEVATASRAVAFELAGWARVAGHEHVGDRRSGAAPRACSSSPSGGASMPRSSRRRCQGARRRCPSTGANARTRRRSRRSSRPPEPPPRRDGLVPLGALAEAGRSAVRVAPQRARPDLGGPDRVARRARRRVRSGTRPPTSPGRLPPACRSTSRRRSPR